MENTPITPITSLTEEQILAAERYRFSAFKFSLRAPDTIGPNDIIVQSSGLYTFPQGDEAVYPSLGLYEYDAPL